MNEQKEAGLEEQLKLEIPKDKPVPITLTIAGKGKEGIREIKLFLKTLSKLRVGSNATRTSDNGKLVVSLDITRELRENQETQTSKEYATQDGMLLTLTQNGDGEIEVTLKEDTKIQDSREKVGYLQRIIKTFAEVDGKNISFVPVPGSRDAEKKVVSMRVTDVKKLTSIEQEALAEKMFYQNMRKMLEQRIGEMEHQKRPFTQNMLDYIEFWTHLTVGEICHRRYASCTASNFYTITEKLAAEKKLLKVADFLRELYELVNRKTGITKEDIHSDRKPHEIAKARHIMMYITHNKFPFLSFPELGVMFGEVGKPKNHATVLLAEKNDFDKNVGLGTKSYMGEDDVERLYNDAKQKYEARHKK